ncbi:MAG TPA: hypothetical protein VD978_06955 [Azospirillum sp.]|nr:hypothetical protein [Azospirillum sp.]
MVDFSHHVPGRLRVQISRLKHNVPATAILRAALLEIDSIASVTANTATGSVTILYDRHHLDPSILWSTLQRLGYHEREPAHVPPDESPIVEKLASAAADHVTKAALDFALERLLGRPAAALIGALI